MTDIGRAGIVMKGNYNSASTYETLDAVSYQNGLYIAKQNVPVGIVPTNTTYWQDAITMTIIGTTDISGIADGTLTGALSNLYAQLNISVTLNDCNDATSPGIYYAPEGTAHSPSSKAGILYVLGNLGNDNLLQIYRSYYEWEESNIYIRMCNYLSGLGSWYSIGFTPVQV